MTLMTICLIVGGIFVAAAAATLFLVAVRSGQLDDLEETKFRMFREDDGP